MPTPKKSKKAQKTYQKQTNTQKSVTTAPTAAPTAPKTVQPQRLTQKAFKRLQKQWYKKLKKSGFKDIEGGQEHGFLNGNSSTDVRVQERVINNASATQHYYSKWSCYLAHHTKGELMPIERAVIEMHSQGLGIHDMLKKLGRYTNYYQLHYLIERLRVHIDLWNRTDPNGMDFEADVDNAWPLKK